MQLRRRLDHEDGTRRSLQSFQETRDVARQPHLTKDLAYRGQRARCARIEDTIDVAAEAQMRRAGSRTEGEILGAQAVNRGALGKLVLLPIGRSDIRREIQRRPGWTDALIDIHADIEAAADAGQAACRREGLVAVAVFNDPHPAREG